MNSYTRTEKTSKVDLKLGQSDIEYWTTKEMHHNECKENWLENI